MVLAADVLLVVVVAVAVWLLLLLAVRVVAIRVTTLVPTTLVSAVESELVLPAVVVVRSIRINYTQHSQSNAFSEKRKFHVATDFFFYAQVIQRALIFFAVKYNAYYKNTYLF